MNIKTTIKQNPAMSFVVLTLGLSLLAFLVPAEPESKFATVVYIDLLFPTIVAIALVTVIEGRQGAKTFLRQIFRWRSSLKWYGIALLFGFSVHFGSSLLALVMGRIPTIQIAAPTVFSLVFFFFALLEEIGWRGFALPRLLDRFSPVVASLIVGIPWAFLHFALWTVFQPNIPSVPEGLFVIGFAFLLTWIYIKSNRNVLVATVAHGTLNAFSIFAVAIPLAEAYWFMCVSVWLITLVLFVADHELWFAHPKPIPPLEAVPSII